MNNVARYILAVLVVVALAQFMPEVVNWVLVLILIGIVLMRYKYFQDLVNQIGSIGKK